MGDKPFGHEIEKAEPAIIRERRLAEEAKSKKAKERQDQVDEHQAELAKTGYVYFKPADLKLLQNRVVVHPTVLLSVADHFARAAHGTNKRVVGVLLAEAHADGLHITNTFGVPFEEDPKDPTVWYLDHRYLERMCIMFKKINARESIAGWYSTESAIKESDIEIHELIRKYCQHPIFLLVNVHTTDTKNLPVQSYYSFEQPSNDEHYRRSFVHMSCEIGATEAEEVGVEHLLRDIQSVSTSTLSNEIGDRITALKHLAVELKEISNYLAEVADGKLPQKTHILTQLQHLMNSLPDKTDAKETAASFQMMMNDSLLCTFVAFSTRVVMQLHELVRHKMAKPLQDEDVKKSKKPENNADTQEKTGGTIDSKKPGNEEKPPNCEPMDQT